jgi:sulfoxide reductase catalytic subunit YedY
MKEIKSSEITPEHLYLSRRRFIKTLGTVAAGALILKACGPDGSAETPGGSIATPGAIATPGSTATAAPPLAGASTDELGDPLTTFDAVTHYNNYYEFTVQKEGVARLAENFVTSPWQVEVGGLVNNPKTYDLDALRKFEQEERIYRLRCVEAWSMVIPWIGFPLSALLKEVEPLSSAKYVRFETLYDPEAMHDLTLLATGLYGKDLLPQNGAPVRLVVPWKYGFKSIKSIVRIDLVEEMPVSLWMAAAPNEYGFYANVNPDVDHPRWSQATERRIGESGRRVTLFMNGYAEEVAGLYQGMDLKTWY